MRTKQRKTAKQLADDIHSELRRILEIRRDIFAPITAFEPAPPYNGVERFFVLFDQHQRVRFAEGLKLGGTGVLSIPDERISDLYFNFAMAVWHLKDRLRHYSQAAEVSIDIQATEVGSRDLLICADLSNWKKHGAHGDRSALRPYLSEVRFDLSKSGGIELYYDGVMKKKGLIVSNLQPIPFHIDVLTGEGRSIVGNAREIINTAFCAWIPLIEMAGLFSEKYPAGPVLHKILAV